MARIHQERRQLHTGELQEKWESVRYQHSLLQRKLAEELTKSTGITIPEEGCGIREIEQFQRILATENIAIMIYNFRTFGRGENPMYDGCSLLSSLGRESSCRLNVMYYEGSRHYNPILNLKAAAGSRGGYCVACNVGFRNDRGYGCTKNAHAATSSYKRSYVELIKCDSRILRVSVF